jgi:hypothetical protein
MAKIKITQKQYTTILLHEQEARLMGSGDIITETLEVGPEVLEEGWKEVVLGVAMMLGVGLSGQNKAIAQDVVKNAQTMAQVKATLEDTAKTQELVDLLKQKGMKNPEQTLANNAEKVVDEFNKIAKDNGINPRMSVKTVHTLQALKGGLEQGYALKKADMTADTVQGQETIIKDVMNIDFISDGLFVTGGFTLSQAGIDTITVAINEIKKQGGKILNVEIESSTDAERTPKFINKNDPTGNIQLASLRTKSVSDLINSLESGISFTHREIPNNGSHVVSSQEFQQASNNPEELKNLRVKSSEFRYVKLKFTVEFSSTTKAPPIKIIQNYRFELVKVIDGTAKTHKITTKTQFKHKKYKCPKIKGHTKSVQCWTN